VKVEYTGLQGDKQKWISFMVSASSVNSGQYAFRNLVQDITQRCTSLDFLNERTMRIRYLDDEENWINLNFDDERGFTEIWQCARMVPEREFKRIKLRAGVLGSPVQATLSSSSPSSTVVRRAAPFVPSRSETITQKSSGSGLDGSIAVQRDVKLDTSSPVDRMLAQKLESINAATKELENAKMQKENFEREISKAVIHNAGSLSVCGKCHLRSGHTRRNCDGEECTSAMLCGILDKHPGEKSMRRTLTLKVTKCETQLGNLQSEYKNKFQAYKSVEESFSRRLEKEILASDPSKYVKNGIKNWALLNKHVALLQKKCNGKLPPRNSVINLLEEAVGEHEMKTTILRGREKGVNPKKRILEEEFAIKFPTRSSTATCTSYSFGSELEDFRLAVRLQDEWNRQDELMSCANSMPLPTSTCKANDSNHTDDMYMFVPNEGCRAPSFEGEQEPAEHAAANALVELHSMAKTDF